MNRNVVKRGILCVLIVLLGNSVLAQSTASQARQYAADKNYDKAIEVYGELYGISPDSIYTEYLNTLIIAAKYKQAEKLVEHQITANANNPFLHIDLGVVYAKEKKDAKAKEEFDGMVQLINGDDIKTQRIVKAFSDAGRDDYAILAYERAIDILGNPYIYVMPLARLYAKTNHLDSAIDVLLAGNPGQFVSVDNVKALLLELLNNNPDKLQQAQKTLVRKINEQPENNYYAQILTWIYTQRNDWDGALMQIEAVDERNKENGRSLMDFARTAAAAKQYETADKAFDDIITKGSTSPYYIQARNEQIAAAFGKIKNDPAYKPDDVARLAKLYDSFLVQYPKYYGMQMASDYAMLEAQYGNDVPKAIEILQRGIDEPDTRRNMGGQFKLQLGDYYLLTGKLWDASLTYSQVDKDFKQDALGEDARFRNAKLAYYRGDFEWAQRQLSVLKASTSDLIANDALYLSVLITENVEDSNYTPLQRYAYADLLLFQNKDKEAETLLDSIATAYPKHPLNDDIIMLHADIARKRHNYDKALEYLKNIYEHYGQDVLGDDAVFKMADIYQNDLHQNDKAKTYYEQLIIDYPGSTFVQIAMQRLSELNNGITTP